MNHAHIVSSTLPLSTTKKEIEMKSIFAMILMPLCAATMTTSIWADDDSFQAKLEGYQEVPAISSPGTGKFSASLIQDSSLQYVLSYQNRHGTPFMSHIHFGKRNATGGIMVWLCGNAPATPPAGTPACPVPGGTVTGTLTAAQVIGPAGQLIAAGEFAEVIETMNAGSAYVNAHSNLVATGKIRGQVKRDDHD
jgi:CHRD domain